MKLNYGCGEAKLEDFINVDTHTESKPDLVCDLKTSCLPFQDASLEQINAMHILEHIEFKFWDHVMHEFNRVLQPNGLLILAYPEFERCAKYFIENYRGLREFWRKTLYGRQLYPGDYHIVPMRTGEILSYLKVHGFTDVKYIPEVGEEWNTFLTCKKAEVNLNREDVLRREIFN